MRFFSGFRRTKSTVSAQTSSSILDILENKPIGSIKSVKGWVKSIRKMKDLVFFDVTDGSCSSHLQIGISKNNFPQMLKWGTSVNAYGKVFINKNGQIELIAEQVTIIGNCDITDGYPFTPKQNQSFDLYRQYLHFRPHLNYFTSLFRFRSAVTINIHQYFINNGFVNIHTPIITSNDCEGAGETFMVQPYSESLNKVMKKEHVCEKNAFFDSPAFLTVSGQLHLEAVTRRISKVYTFNPSFRAENSKSRFHLSEFYMIEAEEAFVTDLTSVLQRIENFLKQLLSPLISNHSSTLEYLLKHSKTDVVHHMRMLENIINNTFTVMTFNEAKSVIHNKMNKTLLKEMDSDSTLTRAEEIFLVQNNNNVPVFIIHWPAHGKPFYMKGFEEDSNVVKGVDLLVPNIGELCGGGIREDNYDILKEKLENLKILDSMKWYLDLRKYGNVPTGGFGMGFERFFQFLLNIKNIKDTLPFPRWPHGLQL